VVASGGLRHRAPLSPNIFIAAQMWDRDDENQDLRVRRPSVRAMFVRIAALLAALAAIAFFAGW
jgi:hypothetical protein